MSASLFTSEVKTNLLQSLGPAPAVNVVSVLQLKAASHPGDGTAGGYLKRLLPPSRQTDGYIMGIPSSLAKQASEFETFMRSSSAKLAWARTLIESIRPEANLDDVSRLLACWKFDRAFSSKSQYLTEEQKEAVNLVRQLTAENSTSIGRWREALHKTTHGIVFAERTDPRFADGMTEWRELASTAHASIERLSNNEAKKHIASIAWITAELAYGLLDPWWKSDSAAVENYAQKLLELVRTA
jgi:hypothetical protein